MLDDIDQLRRIYFLYKQLISGFNKGQPCLTFRLFLYSQICAQLYGD